MTNYIKGPERRYAKALFELANEANADITTSLTALKSALDSSQELSLLLESPIINKAEKLKVLTELLKSTKAPELLINFISVVVNKGRSELLSTMIDCYIQLDLSAKNIVTATVTSAASLTSSQKEAIANFIKSSNQNTKEVKLEEATDASLIAGFKVQVGSVEYDTSVLGKLNNLRTALKV